MGTCISKCRPKKNNYKEDHQQQFNHNNVQDKLVVIAQTPKTPTQIFPLVNPNRFVSASKTPPSPSHSTSSSSVSSFVTCTASKTSVSSSSLSSMCSSSASSAIITKDNSSFSNEFVWSCYKENPHVVRINSLKDSYNKPPLSTKTNCPQKRVRSNSPINHSASLTRQKSFRRDQSFRDFQNLSSLRSPSPSRRFGNNIERLECHSKRLGSNYYNHSQSQSLSRRENQSYSNSSRLSRPCNNMRSYNNTNTTREQRNVHRVSSKLDEIAVAEALARNEIDNLLVEDIDNPLISMDCFIFI